jgi:hypothetical protein
MDDEMTVVSKKAWQDAVAVIEIAAKGYWSGDDDWDAVVKRWATRWLDDHGPKVPRGR